MAAPSSPVSTGTGGAPVTAPYEGSRPSAWARFRASIGSCWLCDRTMGDELDDDFEATCTVTTVTNADGSVSIVRKPAQRRRGGFRWVVLLFATLGMLVTGMSYVSSLFIIPVGDEFGVSRSVASFSSTVNFFAFSIGCTVAGRMAEYYGVWKVWIAGTIMCVGGHLLAAIGNNIGVFIFTFGIVNGLGYALVYMCTLAIQGGWFPDNLGMAFGITLAGIGAGNMIFSPIVAAFISDGGWRYACNMIALILGICYIATMPFVVIRGGPLKEQHERKLRAAALSQTQVALQSLAVVPVAAAPADSTPTIDAAAAVPLPSGPPVVPREPSSPSSAPSSPSSSSTMGDSFVHAGPTAASGEEEASIGLIIHDEGHSAAAAAAVGAGPPAAPVSPSTSSAPATTTPVGPGASVVKTEMAKSPPLFEFAMMKERPLHMFMWASGFTCFSYYAPFFSLVPYADDMGLSSSEQSVVLAVLSVTSIIGRVGGGWVSDRFGALLTFELCSLGSAALALGWMSCTTLGALGTLAAFYGVMAGGLIAATTAAMPVLVGVERSSSALGLVYGMAWLPGSVVIGFLMGLSRDETGSYAGSVYPLAGFSLLAMLFTIAAGRAVKQQEAKAAAEKQHNALNAASPTTDKQLDLLQVELAVTPSAATAATATA